MNTQAVFFDLDGTLIDTAPDMGGALNRLLIRHRRPPVAARHYRAQVSHGSIALLKLGFPELAAPSEFESLRTEFLNEYEKHLCNDSLVFTEMVPVLEQLEQLNIPWGIITNKPEYLTLSLLDKLDLTRRCCCIIGADTAARAKPHPEPMLLACKRTDVVPERCVYVGDAERDIQAGLSVGMKSLVAGWGYIDPLEDNPEQWGADDYLSSPEMLLQHITRQNN